MEVVSKVMDLVDQTFFASWSWWPRMVARDLGKCLEMRLVIRPGMVVR